MRRVQAIAVIVALLATPLALMARTDCCDATCACMCALVQKTLAARSHQQHARMLCGQLPGQKTTCTTCVKHQQPDYGLNMMMAPTMASPLAVLAGPASVRGSNLQFAQISRSGFLAAPFQPPRS